MAPSAPPDSVPVPLIHRRSFRDFATQSVYVAITAVAFVYVYVSLDLRDFGLGFLNDPAAFKVGNQWIVDVDGVTNTRITMYMVGVWASIRAVIVAIALSTIVGVVVGVSRLSPNWLVAQLAMLFVETFRNTPLLVQVVLVYAVFLVGMPLIQNVISIGDLVFISNRGVAMPWPVPSGGLWGLPHWIAGVWVLALLASAFVAMRVRARRQEFERETGTPMKPNRRAFIVFAIGAVVSYVVLGGPVVIDAPIVTGTHYAEGITINPEFAALVTGLTLYTGAFIAEVVRAGIQALPTGQTEAANAVGLTNYQRLTLVILPQALRQIIPSVTNQYLNVNKNSSLAYAVLYDDLFRVAGIVQNKAGHALEMFVLIIATYMVISFIISAIMNFFNSRVTVHEV